MAQFGQISPGEKKMLTGVVPQVVLFWLCVSSWVQGSPQPGYKAAEVEEQAEKVLRTHVVFGVKKPFCNCSFDCLSKEGLKHHGYDWEATVQARGGTVTRNLEKKDNASSGWSEVEDDTFSILRDTCMKEIFRRSDERKSRQNQAAQAKSINHKITGVNDPLSHLRDSGSLSRNLGGSARLPGKGQEFFVMSLLVFLLLCLVALMAAVRWIGVRNVAAAEENMQNARNHQVYLDTQLATATNQNGQIVISLQSQQQQQQQQHSVLQPNPAGNHSCFDLASAAGPLADPEQHQKHPQNQHQQQLVQLDTFEWPTLVYSEEQKVDLSKSSPHLAG